jgi:radical SAM protein with 4Fe4S-binding SPASM domain
MKAKSLFDFLFNFRLPRTPEPIPAGLHHYTREANGSYTRFHLRVEPDGSGMLLANASLAARLSPSGVVIAQCFLEGQNEADVLRNLFRRYRGGSGPMVNRDVERIRELLTGLAKPGDNYPILNLTDAAFVPYEAELFAPLEASLPLAAPEQIVPILDKLWEIGIPHVTFLTSGDFEATYLLRAVERAEDLGMIAGVRGRASNLNRDGLIRELAQTGVDHITLLVAAATAELHDELCGAGDFAAVAPTFAAIRENEVCPVAEIPLVATNWEQIKEVTSQLQAWGVENFSFFAIAAPESMAEAESGGALAGPGLPQVAAYLEEMADVDHGRFLWQPPVRRDPTLTLTKQVQQGPRCAGDVAVRIEPDGTVIPPRGPQRSAGNILQDEWSTIWEDEAFRIYRQRIEAPTHCALCPGLAVCAADCPARSAGWSSQ